MKKFLSLLLAMTMIFGTVALTACTGGGTQGQQGEIPGFKLGDATFDTTKDVTITFYTSMGNELQDILKGFINPSEEEDGIAQFNELYPNITVNIVVQSKYDETRKQIISDLQVGAHPDIAYCYPDHVAMYERSGKVVTLDQFINHDTLGLTDEQKADFIEVFFNEGRGFAPVNGVNWMYTLPFQKSTEVLYYNKTFFEKHGLEVPKTWNDVEELCKKILEIDPDCTPFGYDSESNWFITMCEQLGSGYTTLDKDNHFVFDNPTNRAFVKRFAEWYANGWATTEYLNNGTYTSNLFKEQKSYFGIGSSAGAGYQRPGVVGTDENGDNVYLFDVGIAPIPQENPSNPKVISQGPSLVMLDTGDTQRTIAAWLFMKYLTTTPELQAAFGNNNGYLPVIKSVSNLSWFKEKLDNANGGDNIQYLSMQVCMEMENYYYTSPAFNGSSTARDSVGTILQKAMELYANGNIDAVIDQYFREAMEECEMSQ